VSEPNDIPPPVIDTPQPPVLAEPPTLHERILLVTVALTLAGVCWLISSSQGAEAGHIPWRSGSLLRAVTTLMALNFEYPTPRGVEVKWLIQSLGAAVGLLVATTAWYVRRQDQNYIEATPTTDTRPADGPRGLRHRPPWDLAQLLLLGFTGWMFLSAVWSPWPEAARGEGVRQLIFVVWAVALGRTLGRRGVRQSAMIMVVVLAFTAVIGIWYYYERNPQQRLKFPIGNPIFMAACLLPGITLILWAGWAAIVHRIRTAAPVTAGPAWRPWLLAVGGVIALVVLLKALQLTD